MKNFGELSSRVLIWANERGIFDNSEDLNEKWKYRALAQLDKTQEELNETIEAVKQEDEAEIRDGIGDILVTIIIASKMLGEDPERCLEIAYNEIKNRTGKMVDGKFVKDQ
jgi:NTP pyrophosphatase (non-canonical NTP hydrolase)